MALISNLSDIPDLGPVAEGEYDLRVTSAKVKTFDSGTSCINLSCEIVGEDNAETVWHKLWLPKDSDEQSKVTNKLRSIKEFMQAVGLDPAEGVSDEAQEFVGIEFTAMLKLEAGYPDPEQQVNAIARVV